MEGDLGVPSSQLHPFEQDSPRTLPPARPAKLKVKPPPLRQSSLPKTPIDEDIIARIRRYMVCWATVEFDIDLGPALDATYPSTPLSPELSANIAFSSLPEGELPVAGAAAYHWRIPIPPQDKTMLEWCRSDGRYDGALHGFVWFVQEKNAELRRGYSQRSLVLITHLSSLPGLFASTLSLLGPLHGKHPDGGMVESACHNIAAWPELVQGSIIDLPFLGEIQSISVPMGNQPQWAVPPIQPKPGLAVPPIIPSTLPLTPLSVSLHTGLTLSRLLLLWELVLLGEPILIFSADPRAGADLVTHLRNLIRPVLFVGDERPYLHIHDIDFTKVANSKPPRAGLLLSSTNPHILHTCRHWPHILHLGSRATGGPEAGLKSTRKRHVTKSDSLQKEVDAAFGRGDYVGCDQLLFQHLATLTERFLAPLNRYFGTLAAPPSATPSAGPLSSPSLTQGFHPPDFLASLTAHGSPITFRGAAPQARTRERFYTRFLGSPQFKSWLRDRTNQAGEAIKGRWLDSLEQVNLDEWIGAGGGRNDREVEQLVGRLEREAVVADEREGIVASSSGEGLQVDGAGARAGSDRAPSRPVSPAVSLSGLSRSDSGRGARLRGQADRLRALRSQRLGVRTDGLGGSGSEVDSTSPGPSPLAERGGFGGK